MKRARRAKWQRWIATIGEELERLGAWRDARAAALSALEVLPELRAAAGLLHETYVHALAMGVRRQLKPGSRNVCLGGLLAELADHAHEAGLDAAEVRRDLAALRRRLKPVESFADRAVAHADRRAPASLSVHTLHAALDALAAVHAKYADRKW